MKLNQSVQKAAAILRAAAARPDGERPPGWPGWLVYRTPPLRLVHTLENQVS